MLSLYFIAAIRPATGQKAGNKNTYILVDEFCFDSICESADIS